MFKYFIGIFLFSFAQTAASAHTNATVELAIFCDFDFGEHFQHNETKIREYWAIRMYDTNLRFKTLPSVDINFVVTSLTTVKRKDDQGFIEERRDNTGKVAIENVLRAFPGWVNSRYNSQIPGYDIALLALGADTSGNHTSRAFVDAACDYYHRFAVVRFEKDNWWNSCGPLEFGLSTVLGTWADSDYSTECHNGKYIKGRECSKNHFYFSSCTNDAIRDSIKHSACLHRIDSDVPNIFNISELNVQPRSIREQCILMTNNPNTFVNITDENRCFSTICYSKTPTNATAEKILYPVDNSPCDNEKSCFRGRCIPNGFQIQHAQSSKCLHSTNLFTSEDNLQLIHCPDVPTALDRFMILEKGDQAVFLATPYTSVNGSVNSDKCISYISSLDIVQFQNCYESPNQTSEFYWEPVDLGDGTDEFLLRHKISQLCLASTASDRVSMGNCHIENRNKFWKFSAANSRPFSNVFWKSKPTPKPTEISVTTLRYDAPSATLNDLAGGFVRSGKGNMNCAYHNWWVYLGFTAFTFVTVILSLTIFKLRKKNKQILMRQLLTQDFHELSRVIASENVYTSDLI